MKIKLEWIENKTNDWKVASVTAPDGYKTDNVSINRADKKGKQFPNFDGLRPGMEIEGNLWKSPTSGKWSLFGPNEASVRRTSSISAAVEKKQEGIRQSQEHKDESIKTSSTARDATLILTTFYQGLSEEEIKEKWKMWRSWLGRNWENVIDTSTDVPFD